MCVFYRKGRTAKYRENVTYNTRIPLIIKDEQYSQHLNSHNFTFFKCSSSNSASYLHLFNANIDIPEEQLLGYEVLNDYNPIYRPDSTY